MALCEYAWPNFTSVLEFVNFNQMVRSHGKSPLQTIVAEYIFTTPRRSLGQENREF